MRASILFTMVFGVAFAHADVDVEFRVEPGQVNVGDTARIGLYAVADNFGENEPFSLMEIVLLWEAEFLRLEGVDDNGPYAWMFSGFPDDSGLDGLNNTFDDGNADYQAWGNLGGLPVAFPEGLLVTTLLFEALAPTSGTDLVIARTFGSYTVTAVYDDQYGGWNIVGDLGTATIEIGSAQYELGDLNCDGVLDAFDVDPFVMALTNPEAYQAAYPDCDRWLADINGDGILDVFDIDPFVELLGGD